MRLEQALSLLQPESEWGAQFQENEDRDRACFRQAGKHGRGWQSTMREDLGRGSRFKGAAETE